MKILLLLLSLFFMISCSTFQQQDLVKFDSISGSEIGSKYLIKGSPLTYTPAKEGKKTLFGASSWILSSRFNTSNLKKRNYDEWRKHRYKDLDSIVTVKITYKTRIVVNGPKDIQSGLLILPLINELESKPITWIIWARGTDLSRDNAPSTETNSEVFLAKLLANLGFAVWMPDYAGSGDSKGPQTYCVPESHALSALDGLSAAREYLAFWKNSYIETGRLNVIGYSQGGLSSMAIGYFIDSGLYELDHLNLGSVYSMGAPLDLMIDAGPDAKIDSPIPRPEFTLSLVVGWARAYPEVIKIEEILKPIVIEKILPYFNGSPSNEELEEIIYSNFKIEKGSMTYKDLFLPSYLMAVKNNPESVSYYELQKSAKLDSWVPQKNINMILAASMEDEVVNPQNTINAYSYMKNKGYEPLEFIKLNSDKHIKAGGESLVLGIMLLDKNESKIK